MEVNGTPLNESYLAPGDKPSMVPFTINVPKGYIWVQGDHRSDSEDSRYHRGGPAGGAVPVDDVVGRVVALVWPWGHARTFPRPATYAALER
jgi:signal peptidase I